MENVSIGTLMMPPLAFNIIKGRNSRTVKVTLPQFELKLNETETVISIIFTFH